MRNTWFGVELRHLAALAALAEEGSFRGAADALGYVQSAVSSQLAHLEQLLDIRLVERQRGPGPIYLTEAGQLLLSHTSDILARFEAARSDLDLLREGRAGLLRLGASESVAAALLPDLVNRFRRRVPDIALELVEAPTDHDLWNMVQSGQVDAAFCDMPLVPGSFEWCEVLEDPYVLAAASGSPLAASTVPLAPDRLSRLPLIDHRLMRHVEAQLRPLGFEPRYVLRSDVYSTVRSLVAGGVGAAIVPRLVVGDGDESISVSNLDGVVAGRSITICWNAKRELVPGIEELVDTARAVCATHRDGHAALQLAS